MTWDDAAFIARVRALIDVSGRSQTAVLEESGQSRSYLDTERKYGRRIDAIITLAQTLGRTMEELCGLPVPSSQEPQPLDIAYMVGAIRAASAVSSGGSLMAADEAERFGVRCARVYELQRRRGSAFSEAELDLVASTMKTETTR